MSKWSTRFMSAAAIMVVLCGSVAQAAVITVSYVNVQTSTTSNFATGTVTNQGTNTAAIGSVPVGGFFRFGLAVSVTGNPNSASVQSAWSSSAFPQPANLGMQQMLMQILSSDGQNSPNVQAIQGAPLSSRNASTGAFANAAALWSNTDKGDVLGNANPGTTGTIAAGQGQIGVAFPITSLNSAFQNNGQPAGALANGGATWINSLAFAVVGNASVTLTAVAPTGGQVFWDVPSDNGDSSDPDNLVFPTYTSRSFATSFGPEADSLVLPAPIVVNNLVPEPTTAGLVGLALLGLVGRRRSK